MSDKPVVFDTSQPLPPGLVDVGVTVISITPYMAVLTFVTNTGVRQEITIERGGAGAILHALADYLGTEPDDLLAAAN